MGCEVVKMGNPDAKLIATTPEGMMIEIECPHCSKQVMALVKVSVLPSIEAGEQDVEIVVDSSCKDGDCDCEKYRGANPNEVGWPPYHDECCCYAVATGRNKLEVGELAARGDINQRTAIGMLETVVDRAAKSGTIKVDVEKGEGDANE